MTKPHPKLSERPADWVLLEWFHDYRTI